MSGPSVWSEVDLVKATRQVLRQQRRLATLYGEGRCHEVRQLMRGLANALPFWLVAVHRVCRENRGARTPGIDGIAKLTDQQMLDLAQHLRLEPSGAALRCTTKPKRDGGTREIAIPNIADRVRQTVARMLLEPEWDQRLHAGMFGSLPRGGVYDALRLVLEYIRDHRYKIYAGNADIMAAFDSVDHGQVLEKLSYLPPRFLDSVESWLRAPVVDYDSLTQHEKEEGVAQGMPIAPLLLHAVIEGMHERVIAEAKKISPIEPLIVTYVDDILVLHPKRAVVKKALNALQEFLATRELAIHAGSAPKRASVWPVFENGRGDYGFDYLGCNIFSELTRELDVSTAPAKARKLMIDRRYVLLELTEPSPGKPTRHNPGNAKAKAAQRKRGKGTYANITYRTACRKLGDLAFIHPPTGQRLSVMREVTAM